MPLTGTRYAGPLFRALNPVYARAPLSGRGAELYGGRFNARGTAALYTALDPATALREANQVGDLQPTILVSYRADLGPIFDTRDQAALAARGVAPAELGDPAWRMAMLDGHPGPTQRLAMALRGEGYVGLLVRSFAKGADAHSLNLVLWAWDGEGRRLEVVDDEGRLERI